MSEMNFNINYATIIMVEDATSWYNAAGYDQWRTEIRQ